MRAQYEMPFDPGPEPTACTDAEMYSLLLETYIKDPVQKDHLFRAVDTIPCVAKKADWAIKWITRCVCSLDGPMAACVVGLPRYICHIQALPDCVATSQGLCMHTQIQLPSCCD